MKHMHSVFRVLFELQILIEKFQHLNKTYHIDKETLFTTLHLLLLYDGILINTISNNEIGMI